MISESQYLKLVEPHRRALSSLELDLNFFLNDIGDIDVYRVQSRIKAWDSALAKSDRLNLQIKKIDDLAGLRIIVGTQSEIPVIERFFTRQEIGNDLKVLKRNIISKKDGYRALHLVLEVKGHFQRSMFPGRVEVQLQTVFQHAFNFLSHSWKYKKNYDMPVEWNQSFVEISKTLDILEKQATELHSQIAAVASDSADSLVTPHSFRVLCIQGLGEEVSLIEAVDYCRFYTDLGYKTNHSLRAFFTNRKIQEFWKIVENSKSNKSLKHIFHMGKAGFWHFFGTRIDAPGLREFFDSIVNNSDDQ